ncbi:hypothetical protein DENIS_0669 [Desulfonema ishimotonii]|uniref:Uncharacterized protein n=1 Tax=Desulfonema ishimotonii TaxID=45657 RepID=A0A401FRZ3_9BACT|nr:hypothetical protein [Desulfonema ishimotonii]GBC59728.1 hypothetical protein DENIS_0669 [Desulfonema ishimotonii]
MRYIALLLLFVVATPCFSEIAIHTKDGRTVRVQVEADEISRIEFVTTAPPPAKPITAPTPAKPTFIQALLNGKDRPGEAWGDSGGRWNFKLKITSYDRATGYVVGQITWPSLSSVHRVRGKLTGDKLTFTEVEAIRPGGAHLNVSYTFTLGNSSATGRWLDNGDKSHGGAKIK